MANAYFYSNTAIQTTLSGSISSGATSVQVGATTGFPVSYPYVLALDYGAAAEELVSVTAAAGTTLTVVRGFGSTSAQSHSLGAVVRHVVNAVDLTDFRTHEAATGAVHGVAGALVGTTDTQTLTNKTVSSPTISSGALSGTFTGSPTFSGAPTFSGGGTLSGTWAGTPTFSGALTLNGGGTLAGTFAGTPTFSGIPSFTTGVNLSGRASYKGAFTGAEAAYASNPNSESFDRWRAYGDGKQEWGTGALARDTNLYRNAAAELKTDGALTVVGALTAGSITNVNTGAWSTYTPAWTATTGTNPTPGNSTVTGLYYRTGRMINVFIRVVVGSTFVPGNGAGSENWLFSLPIVPAAGWDGFRVFNADLSDVSANQHWGGTGAVDTASSGRIGTLVASDHTTTAIWDSSAPVSINTGDILTIWGSYEASS